MSEENRMKENIRDLELPELEAVLLELGEPKFRAKQIYSWLHVKLCDDFSEMTNVSKPLREKLQKTYTAALPEICEVLTSKLDGTKSTFLKCRTGMLLKLFL